MEWRDIDSAPKDGTEVLVTEVVYSPFVAYWSGTFKRWSAEGSHDYCSPTHWMPLPPPPERKG